MDESIAGSIKQFYKRACNATKEWLPSYFIGTWHKIEMEVPNYATFEDDLISNDYITADGLRWNILVRPDQTNIGMFLRATMDEDDGSHWKCEADMCLTIFSKGSTYHDITKKSEEVAFSRENDTLGFPTVIDKAVFDKDSKKYYTHEGSLKILINFRPRIPTGFYTPGQLRMKSILEDETASDLVLVPTGDKTDENAFCHASILLSCCESPVLQRAIKKVCKNRQRQTKKSKIQLDLTGEAIESLLEFIYYEEDFCIFNIPGICHDLFKFGLEYKMPKLVDRCLQAFSSDLFQDDAANFDTDMALDLYLVAAVNMGQINDDNSGGDGNNTLMTVQRCSNLAGSMLDILKLKNLQDGDDAEVMAQFLHDNPQLSFVLKKELEDRVLKPKKRKRSEGTRRLYED